MTKVLEVHLNYKEPSTAAKFSETHSSKTKFGKTVLNAFVNAIVNAWGNNVRIISATYWNPFINSKIGLDLGKI